MSDVEPSARNRMFLEMPITALIFSYNPNVCYNFNRAYSVTVLSKIHSVNFYVSYLLPNLETVFQLSGRSEKRNHPRRRTCIKLHISLPIFKIITWPTTQFLI